MTPAVSAGFYASPGWGQNYPKVQILTIQSLLAGAKVDIPPTHTTFKQAAKAQTAEAEQGKLFG